MKVLVFASILVVAYGASLFEEEAAQFEAFKIQHGKTYESQTEEIERFNIFEQNLRSIQEHNALYELGLVSYKKGINQFTDRTKEELKALLSVHHKNWTYPNAVKHVKSGLAVPDSVDWRTDGQVSDVKNQGSCGSCWAFSVIGSIEAAHKRKSGSLVSLSVQQLVDCSDVGGCSGVYHLYDPYPYLEKSGVEADSVYPYTGEDGTCRYEASKVVTKVSDYHLINAKDEAGLLDAVATVGPVAVAIDASDLFGYESGVFEDKDCTETLNHGVLVVGYGSENGKNYWIVKNSWGADFGEKGYFKIVRGINECGIADQALYPIIN